MKAVVIGGLALAFAFIAPAYIEGSESNCGAVAMKAVAIIPDKETQNPLARGMINAMAGPLVAAAIHVRYPNVPPVASCTWMYWRMTVDTSYQADLQRRMKS